MAEVALSRVAPGWFASCTASACLCFLSATGWNASVSETSKILDELTVFSGSVGADFSWHVDGFDVGWPQQPVQRMSYPRSSSSIVQRQQNDEEQGPNTDGYPQIDRVHWRIFQVIRLGNITESLRTLQITKGFGYVTESDD